MDLLSKTIVFESEEEAKMWFDYIQGLLCLEEYKRRRIDETEN